MGRRLVGVEIAGPRLAFNDTKWPVRAGGEVAGRITSALYSPRLERNIGYAWVPVALAEPGTELIVETPVEEATARVVQMPFVDPTKRIPKS